MIVMIALLSFVDLLAFAAALDGLPTAPGWFVPVHLALTFSALLIWRIRDGREGSTRSFAFPIGAAIGPFGMMLLFWLKPWARLDLSVRRIAYVPPRPRKRRPSRSVTPLSILARILDERVCYPEGSQIESLVTILQHGPLPARRAALETVVRSFEPRLSPLILKALGDSDQTIRALAAAAAAQVSCNLAQRREDLDSRLMLRDNLEDLYELGLLLADHGRHNELLSRPQRAHLCRSAAGRLKELDARMPKRDARRRTARTILAELAAETSAPAAPAPAVARVQMLESVP